MADGYVEVYTDGACENNGKPNAKAGIGVWFGEEHPLNVSKPVVGRATNNRAEIQACTEGLNRVKEHGELHLTKWVPTWEKNDWKTVRGQPVKNREELQELTQAVSGFKDVQWRENSILGINLGKFLKKIYG
ncbi:hypothetical protein NQ317_011361 [Molorchus minor]|uniref:RNase H type-1 domain-containing protein n=1 Tax=Molorchus minor TaxID=1323400 RepID=A0ABQ9JEC0_9CUCU|nr:hypothetical protein NQ317_011361 [Molorchus minor]